MTVGSIAQLLGNFGVPVKKLIEGRQLCPGGVPVLRRVLRTDVCALAGTLNQNKLLK